VTGEGVAGLLEAVGAAAPNPPVEVQVLIPWARGDLVAMLYDEAEVLKAEAEPDGTRVHARVGLRELAAIREYMVAPLATPVD
jgi:GTPase